MKAVLGAVTAVLALSPGWAHAEEELNPTLHEKFTLRAGIHRAESDKSVSAQREGRPDFSIDLNTLNVDDDYNSPYLMGVWRASDRIHVALTYFGTHNDGTRVLDANIRYEDVVYRAGASLRSEFDLDILIASVGYNFVHSDRAVLGAGAGIHVMDLHVAFQGEATFQGNSIGNYEAKDDIVAPVPNLWGYGAFAVTPRLAIEADAGWLSLSAGDFSGRLLTASLGLEYRFTRHFGVGGGYRALDMDLDIDDTDFRHSYNVTLDGPFVYLTTGF